ncbi:MAG: LL-diaminopimelate aminotransferase [Thermaerobacter sp.]|nr:LL-diaminopimelate aminotransferase [Thermaerobacter sp.]
MVKLARRMDTLPPYLFAALDERRRAVEARGIEVISLGIGDPDLPSIPAAVEAVQREAARAANHRYPRYDGLPRFREALARHYQRRFGVTIDAERETLTVIGSKEGLAHLIWAYIEPGDVVLAPDPAYPVYAAHTGLAGGELHLLPLRAERGFLPDLAAIPEDVARRAKLLFLNYPNNPTGATCDLAFLAEAVEYCRRHDILLVHDAAYVEMTLEGEPAHSALEVEGAKDVTIEFYSLSKPFNMTGWRLGAAVGNKEAVAALGRVKNNTDSGQWNAIQYAGAAALDNNPEVFFAQMNATYRLRRDRLFQGLDRLGWKATPPKATFYVWAPVPGGDDQAFAAQLLDAGVVVVPGSGYGANGTGYVRLCLTVSEYDIDRVLERLDGLRPSPFSR